MNVTTPMRDLMVVERFELAKVSQGGILLPNSTLETNTAQGRVLSVGPGLVSDKTGEITEVDLKVGDVVLFHVNAGIKVSEHKAVPEKFLLREEDILAIVI